MYAVLANAGYGHEGPTHEMAEADIRALIETNLYGTLNTIRPVLPDMLKERRGARAYHEQLPLQNRNAVPCGVFRFQSHAGSFRACDAIGAEELGCFRVHDLPPIGTSSEFYEAKQARSGGRDLSLNPGPPPRRRPERVAAAILACLRRPRGEVWTSFPVARPWRWRRLRRRNR